MPNREQLRRKDRTPKAVVLLSGGMDSCVTAAIARQTHIGSLSCTPATASVPSGASAQAFDAIADFFGVARTAGGAARSLRANWRLGADRLAHRACRRVNRTRR